ncbi:hypothetical protein SAMN04489717_0972 [Actinopolymorpha singaporensis]|uniref:Uncharacterized protein n=1 Tax=Actinopolymorpha singaporensis TaxID=117157 RepID=A0A1H1MWX2_9ACTN|nr:hypothetical protein SAMN04489717_0972 [Actinopolymorpha singaporensis]
MSPLAASMQQAVYTSYSWIPIATYRRAAAY